MAGVRVGHLRPVGHGYFPKIRRSYNGRGAPEADKKLDADIAPYSTGYLDGFIQSMQESVSEGHAHQSFIHPSTVLHMGDFLAERGGVAAGYRERMIPLLGQMLDQGYFAEERFTHGNTHHDKTQEAKGLLQRLETAQAQYVK